MSSKIKNAMGLPPRALIRFWDSELTTYPPVARSGDQGGVSKFKPFNEKDSTLNFNNPGNKEESNGERFGPIVDLTTGSGPNYIDGSDLYSYYRLNGSGIDNSGNSRNIRFASTYSGSSVTGTFRADVPHAAERESLFLDGTGNNAEISTANYEFSYGDGANDDPFSISAWIKPTLGSSTSSFPIADKPFEFRFWLASGSQLSLQLFDDGASFMQSKETNVSPYMGGWFHVAATYDGTGGTSANSGIKLYVNGDAKATQTNLGSNGSSYTAMSGNNSFPVTIGAKTGPAEYAKGNFSEVSFFNKVLTAGEIQDIMGYKPVGKVSYPTMLPAHQISRLQTELTSTITAQMSFVKGAGDLFLNVVDSIERISPFNESFLPEQSQSGSFYQTGSRPEDTTIGFSSKLGSKTQISFDFVVTGTYEMHAQSASIIYFNKRNKTFDLAGGNDALTAYTAPESTASFGRDARLFNAFGIPQMSGTNFTAIIEEQKPSGFHGTSITGNDALDGVLRVKQNKNVTLNTNFAATSDQVIPMSGVLEGPLLLEKVVIEMPISCSNCWFDDRTWVISQDGGSQWSDAGGPCVTVSLLNQLASNRREIIMSASVIPAGDTGSYAHQGNSSYEMPAGFGSFGTPNAIVGSMGESRVTIQSSPTVSNAVLLLGDAEGQGLLDALVAEANPFGRALDPYAPSGRSLFGKEYTMRQFSESGSLKYDQDAIFPNGLSSAGNVYFYENHEVAPYILKPTDNLVLAISKHRPVIDDAITRSALTGSHEFGLSSGNIKIKLYGSQVREGKEYHDTLSQELNSDAVHEYIHFDNPVLDQFDIEIKESFSGSYIAEFFTGSMISFISGNQIQATQAFSAENGFLDGRRGRRVSIIEADLANADGTSGVTGSVYRSDVLPISSSSGLTNKRKYLKVPGFHRNVSLISESERYYDTLLPKPDEIVIINGGQPTKESTDNYIYLFLGKETLGTVVAEYFDKDWDYVYPFEPKYAAVPRLTEPLKNLKATVNTLTQSIGAFVTDKVIIAREENALNKKKDNVIDSQWYFIDIKTSESEYAFDFVKNDDVNRALYGIGDGQYGEPIFEDEADIDQITEGVGPVRIVMRGYKHGISNVIREKTKAIFRRDSYGQLRDMLEQRRDTKFYKEDDGTIIIGPVQVRFMSGSSVVDGEDTFSNNVSFESTSSLPYFDGVSRSRGALPSLDSVP